MGIFFNEFNRYKSKSESGQVFTPDHITSLMYKLIEVNKDDYVLDQTCTIMIQKLNLLFAKNPLISKEI
jgi:type I restriction-modification system DNA methylase subunit